MRRDGPSSSFVAAIRGRRDVKAGGRSSSAPIRAVLARCGTPDPCSPGARSGPSFPAGVLLPGRARHVRPLQRLSVLASAPRLCQLRHFSTSRQSLPYKTPTSMLRSSFANATIFSQESLWAHTFLPFHPSLGSHLATKAVPHLRPTSGIHHTRGPPPRECAFCSAESHHRGRHLPSLLRAGHHHPR